ncbi:hypothetical protein KY285_030813 [Solanum tuberosum]|nr:hypothetical protein KY285_030813 [Solanum tuberosum]
MAIISIPSSSTMFPMPQQVPRQNREVVVPEEIGRARMLTLNRPNHLNYLSREVALTLGQNFEKDDNADFVIIKGACRTFSAGGDLHMFYEGRNTMGGGASLMVPMKFSVVTEKAFISSTLETNIEFHPDCAASHTCFHVFQVDLVSAR